MLLLLLDLDNTVADRAAAFDHWMTRTLAAWAPSDAGARDFVLREGRSDVRPTAAADTVAEALALLE